MGSNLPPDKDIKTLTPMFTTVPINKSISLELLNLIQSVNDYVANLISCNRVKNRLNGVKTRSPDTIFSNFLYGTQNFP